MYEFNWEGKELAYKLAQTPSTGTLIPDKESSKNWDDTENLYIEGDNLEVLKLLQKSYFGKVKMIYIDPPYNTGKDFVYKDNFRDNIANYKEITNQTTRTNSETNGRYHTDWLNMMYPRLKLARNLLRENGIIFMSIDDNEVENLKKLCNEIFGESNFVGTYIWKNKSGGGGKQGKNNPNKQNTKNEAFVIDHEYILCYVKNKALLDRFNVDLSEDDVKKYINIDNDKRGSYVLEDLERSIPTPISTLYYKLTDPDGIEIFPKGGKFQWRRSQERVLKEIKTGEIIWHKVKSSNDLRGYYYRPKTKQYLYDENGKIRTKSARSVLTDIAFTRDGAIELRQIFNGEEYFDYPKPTKLIKYIFNMVLENNDIVMDFFSGSGTTAHSVMSINLEKEKNIKYIIVQLPESTKNLKIKNNMHYKNICEFAKERIRRAGDNIVSENKDKEGIENLDIGFKVFKLAYNDLNNKEDDEMYNEKLIELSNKTNIICRQHQVYELNDMYFYILQTEEEYIQWRYKYDILWSTETSEEFYNKIINPIKIEILTNKKPKELKGKKKIATINKDADYKVQVFIDDDCNLYYQDNHAFASCESKIVDNKVETTWNSCKCWFKIIGLYKCRNNHIVDILRDLNSYSEYLYPENNVADNVMLSRLYEQMVNVYLDYVNN